MMRDTDKGGKTGKFSTFLPNYTRHAVNREIKEIVCAHVIGFETFNPHCRWTAG